VDLARWSRCWHNWRPGRAIRGKWRILDGKVESGLDHKFESPRWYPRLCRLCRLSPDEQEFDYVLLHTRFMGPANFVASCVTKLNDTLHRFTGVQWDSIQATYGVSAEAYAWKTALGWGRTRPNSLTASSIVAIHGALLARRCCVVMFLPLQDDYWL
jgi:hypothetical protein